MSVSESHSTNPEQKIPSRFVYSPQRMNGRANRALSYHGPARRLFSELVNPYFYSLDNDHLGIHRFYTLPAMIYGADVLHHWLTRIKEQIEPPFFYRFEIGEEEFSRKLKVHLIAEKYAGLLSEKRGGEVIKPVTDAQGLMAYLSKPPVPYSEQALEEYEWAKQRLTPGKGFPQVSGYIWFKQSKT